MSEDLTKKLPKGDDNVASILLNIDSRLQRLEQKVEERLHDTRPIWEKVVADIEELKGGVRDIKITTRDITRKIGVLYDTMVGIQAEYREFNHRVLDIELEHQKQRNSQT